MNTFDNISQNILYAISNIKTRWIFVIFLVTIAVFAYLYFINIDELKSATDKEGMNGFFTSVYFSIVTISSLGYGDIQPIGFVRVLACIEVILGFLFLGIIIGKISFAKQEYWLRRIYNGITIQNIREFCNSLENEIEEHKELQKYLMTQNNGNPIKLDNHEFSLRFNTINKNIKETIRVIDDFLYYETKVGEILKDVPGGSINMIINSLENILTQWRNLPKWQKEYVIKNDLFLTPLNISRKMKNICTTLKQYHSNRERIATLENSISTTLSFYETTGTNNNQTR